MLDIFAGSGTTLCVANELGMNAVGIDISIFNTMLSNAKIAKYDLKLLEKELQRLTKPLENHSQNSQINSFEITLNAKLSDFNQIHFPNKTFKRQVALKQIDEKAYGEAKAQEFLKIYNDLVKLYHINLSTKARGSFFEKWYMDSIREEIILLKNEIAKAPKV